MRDLTKAMGNLEKTEAEFKKFPVLSFTDFLQQVIQYPDRIIRNVFQLYSDMVDTFVGAGTDEYGDDPESIRFLQYDFSALFVEGSDRAFLPIDSLPIG